MVMWAGIVAAVRVFGSHKGRMGASGRVRDVGIYHSECMKSRRGGRLLYGRLLTASAADSVSATDRESPKW